MVQRRPDEDAQAHGTAEAPSAAASPVPSARFITETGLAAQIASVIEPTLEAEGFRLVRVAIMGRAKPTVQIMAERPDGTMTIEDCATLTRMLSPLLDVHDPLPGEYALEMSSPGIDRPLVRATDFEAWAGFKAKIELKALLDGRKRFRGILEGFEDDEVRLHVTLDQIGETTLGLPIAMIEDAKLMLTDDLVREALSRAKKTRKAAGLSEGDWAPDDDADIEVEGEHDEDDDHRLAPASTKPLKPGGKRL
ncbi:MAG: ribosome maturation factor RimP [Pseudomonadota bacterium]